MRGTVEGKKEMLERWEVKKKRGRIPCGGEVGGVGVIWGEVTRNFT